MDPGRTRDHYLVADAGLGGGAADRTGLRRGVVIGVLVEGCRDKSG